MLLIEESRPLPGNIQLQKTGFNRQQNLQTPLPRPNTREITPADIPRPAVILSLLILDAQRKEVLLWVSAKIFSGFTTDID